MRIDIKHLVEYTYHYTGTAKVRGLDRLHALALFRGHLDSHVSQRDQAPRFLNCLMLNLTEHEILSAHKTKMLKIYTFLAFKLSNVIFIMLINVKILTLMSMINFVLS